MHKARKSLVFPTSPLLDAPAWGMIPSELLDETYPAKTRRMGLYYMVKIA